MRRPTTTVVYLFLNISLTKLFLSQCRPVAQFFEDSATEDHAKSKKAKNQPRG